MRIGESATTNPRSRAYSRSWLCIPNPYVAVRMGSITRHKRSSFSLSVSWSRCVSRPQDDCLSRRIHRLNRDFPVALPSRLVIETSFIGECVHRPQLASGRFNDATNGGFLEYLTSLLRVLRQQGAYLPLTEVAEAQGI